MEERKAIGFELRCLHNLIRETIRRTRPEGITPLTQLQGGIMGYLYHHRNMPIYQKNIEEEFQVSRATATNTLQVMEKNGLILRKVEDRDARLKRIHMTDSALKNHLKVEQHNADMNQAMLVGMTEVEQDELFRFLGIIRENLLLYGKEHATTKEREEGTVC